MHFIIFWGTHTKINLTLGHQPTPKEHSDFITTFNTVNKAAPAEIYGDLWVAIMGRIMKFGMQDFH